MDVSSIAPKASLIVQVVSDAQVQCLANGTLYATTNDGTRRRQVITLNVPVVDTMIMDFISLSPTFDIVNVAVIFRQYNCLATDTQIITVT